MLCPNCQTQFDEASHLPRILIFCGHTFCSTCIETLLGRSDKGDSLQCPDCKVTNQAANGLNSFPKNLVLLSVKTAAQPNPPSGPGSGQKKKEKISPAKPAPGSASKQERKEPRHPIVQVCKEHGKKLEAFCDKDKSVLCIDCILSDKHKNHEIVSVQKAVEKQKLMLVEEMTQASKTEERLKFIKNDIQRYIQEMHSAADKTRTELSAIYALVRELILEREQAQKRTVSELLIREEEECNTKLRDIQELIDCINGLKQEIVASSTEGEIEMLRKSKIRSRICEEINGQRARDLTSIKIDPQQAQQMEIKREAELTMISRIVHPSFKGTPGQQPNLGPSTLYSHTASTANKAKRGTNIGPSGPDNIIAAPANPASQNQRTSKETSEPAIKRGKTTFGSGKSRTGQSPNRNLRKPTGQAQPNLEKKVSNPSGLMILDQNRYKKPGNSFNKPQAQMPPQYGNKNYKQPNPMTSVEDSNVTTDEMAMVCVGPDDMSSIAHVEQHDFINYSPRNSHVEGARVSVKAQNLNDILDSLDKSSNITDQVYNYDEVAQEMKTEKRIPESNSPSKSHLSNSQIHTPKASGLGQRKQSCQISSASPAKVEITNSASRGLHTPKASMAQMERDLHGMISPDASSPNYPNSLSANKRSKTTDKMHKKAQSRTVLESEPEAAAEGNVRLSQNVHITAAHVLNSDSKRKEKRSETTERMTPTVLQSLSQERKKRKAQKYLSKENSPFKQQQEEPNDNSLLVMLQECSKNIEKIEYHGKRRDESPKPAQVFQVDLSKEQTDVNPMAQLIKEELEEPLPVAEVDKREEETINVPEKVEESGPSDESSKEHETQPIEPPFPIEVTPSPAAQGLSPERFNQTVPVGAELPDQRVQMYENELKGSPQKSINNGTSPLKHDMSAVSQKSHGQSSMSVDSMSHDPFKALCRVKEEFIFLFSGFNDSKLFSCEAFDVQRGIWKEISCVSKPRTKFSAVAISKSRILLFGGKQIDGQRTGDIEEYNLKTNKFKTLPFKMPKARSGFASCVKREEGKIFFCGGNSGSILRKFDCLDLKKGKWSRLPDMIQKRDELAVALGPDGMVYAIGGFGESKAKSSLDNSAVQDGAEPGANQQSIQECLHTAERYDFVKGQWEPLPDMIEGRRALACVALPDGIYAIGGYDGKQYLSSVEKFELSSQKWVAVKSMNTSRCTLAAVASADCQYIYALGGYNGNSLDLVERYNTINEQWEFLTPMLSKRFMHEAVDVITH